MSEGRARHGEKDHLGVSVHFFCVCFSARRFGHEIEIETFFSGHGGTCVVTLSLLFFVFTILLSMG